MENDTNIGNVRVASIESEMRQSYLDYAMSVIVQRALPDARDGLKPVHRCAPIPAIARAPVSSAR